MKHCVWMSLPVWIRPVPVSGRFIQCIGKVVIATCGTLVPWCVLVNALVFSDIYVSFVTLCYKAGSMYGQLDISWTKPKSKARSHHLGYLEIILSP